MTWYSWRSTVRLLGVALLGIFTSLAVSSADSDKVEFNAAMPSKINPIHIVGAERCGECHEHALQTLQASSHSQGEKLFATDKAQSILQKLEITSTEQIRKQCATCHYTVKQDKKTKEHSLLSSVSCESCHGSGKRWLNLHWKGEGEKLKKNQLKAAKRGMVRPKQQLAMARRCLECHFISDEALIMKGGHPAGEDFETLKYLTGEVQHNFLRADEYGQNLPVKPEKRRNYYVLGRLVELERGLSDFSKLEIRDRPMAKYLGRRILKSYGHLKNLRQQLPELMKVRELLSDIKLKSSPKAEIAKAASEVGKLAAKLEQKLDVKDTKVFDAMLPSSGVGQLADYRESE